MQDFYDPSRIDSMQEMFKTTAEHPSVIPLNGTKPIPGTFVKSQGILKKSNVWLKFWRDSYDFGTFWKFMTNEKFQKLEMEQVDWPEKASGHWPHPWGI